ncbi:hypothetical protein HPP92_008598 [Vanilla planifolia]|uniref:COP1-interacting protein 7 n=1 Tax=Vanilla planifolia TaxID=51239 RepID=A0A835R507_VANPL|nr:hypothetical protein HPP92_008598 [Vanilla planifolia]
MSGKGNRTKKAVSTDEFLVSSDCRGLGDNHTYAHSGDTEGINGGGKISRNDDFIIYRQEKQMDNKTTSDPLVFCEHEHGGNSENSSSHYVTDESFMVPVRSGSQDLVGADRRLTIDMDTEFPSAPQRNEDSWNKATTRIEYEPDDLTLMLERAKVNETIAYGSAADYDIQAPLVIKQEAKKEENGVVLTTNEELMKTGLEKKLKTPQRGLSNKMKDTTTRKMASSRATPLNEAQKRAEQLRSYKADLQKLKKEQEEEEIQRLEALKRERQKRIAARNDANSAKSSASPQQSKPRFPGKVLPIAYKSSKFMDSDHRTNLPLPKVPIKTTSIGSNESGKANSNSRSNGLSRTASLLRETKNENKLEGNQLSARIRKLSEPKGGAVSRKKGSFNQAVVNKTVAQEPHSKKVSAIIQLDRTKSEALPELKITAYRNPSEPIQSKSAVKEQKLAGSKTMISENINTEKNTNASPNCNYGDENLVVEKTVLMLENKVVPDPAVQTSDMKIEEDKFYGDINRDRPVLDTEYAAIDAPTSSSYRGEIENPSRGSQDDQLNYYENSYEIVDDFSKDEPRSVLDPTVTEKAYSTPSARDSSLEETLPGHSNEEHVKPRNKESKGFRKLWKFGRKGHHGYASGDGNLDSEGIADDHMVATSSNDVSRPFSIFSTLRGKNNEKRIAALA